jgi:hypothetical protein
MATKSTLGSNPDYTGPKLPPRIAPIAWTPARAIVISSTTARRSLIRTGANAHFGGKEVNGALVRGIEVKVGCHYDRGSYQFSNEDRQGLAHYRTSDE